MSYRVRLAAAGGAIAAALLTVPAAVLADGVPLQPFVIDHEHRVASGADVGFLLDRTAGARGFVQVRDGHLVTGDGRRFRCWGVNLAGWTPGSALLPPKASSEAFAVELARLGVNCVRFQFLDLPDVQRPVPGEGGDGTSAEPMAYTPAGLIDARRGDTRTFDAAQLDRMDYLVAQLKAHGIYIDLNLNVGRTYKAGDGVPDYALIGAAKAMTDFGPEIIQREKEYARDLLTHRNPYTGLEYRDDPAVALVEILNENSLLEFWMRNWLRGELKPGSPRVQLDLTPHYKALLTADYNAWLARTRPAAEVEALRKEAGVAPGRPVPLMRRQAFDAASKLRLHDEEAFLVHVEDSFMQDMRAYLKTTLGVKAPVIATNDHTYFISGLPQLRTTSRFEVQDAHAYWQHPAIYGRRATPMVDDPRHSIIVKLARTAMLDQPFTVSEVNEPWPNDYDGEMIPIVASYAAFQDWDAVFVYSFEPKVLGQWRGYIGDHFDIAQDPVKVGELPLGALIFLRHDVATAREVVARTYSTEQVDESARLPASARPYFSPGFPLALPLVHGSRIRCLDCAPMGRLEAPAGDDLASDTGELDWRASGAHTGLVTIATPRTEALTGFIGNAKARGGGETPHLSLDIANAFATVGLSSLDGKPIPLSDRLLLVAAGGSTNTGAAWNARHAMLDHWGGPPTLIEPVTGWVVLKDLEGAVRVTATPFDGAGRALPEVKARMLEDGWEFPIGTPAATDYVIRVTR